MNIRPGTLVELVQDFPLKLIFVFYSKCLILFRLYAAKMVTQFKPRKLNNVREFLSKRQICPKLLLFNLFSGHFYFKY